MINLNKKTSTSYRLFKFEIEADDDDFVGNDIYSAIENHVLGIHIKNKDIKLVSGGFLSGALVQIDSKYYLDDNYVNKTNFDYSSYIEYERKLKSNTHILLVSSVDKYINIVDYRIILGVIIGNKRVFVHEFNTLDSVACLFNEIDLNINDFKNFIDKSIVLKEKNLLSAINQETSRLDIKEGSKTKIHRLIKSFSEKIAPLTSIYIENELQNKLTRQEEFCYDVLEDMIAEEHWYLYDASPNYVKEINSIDPKFKIISPPPLETLKYIYSHVNKSA